MSRSYCALYVDAGYLLAATATRVSGSSLRAGVIVDHQRLIEKLIHQVEEASNLPLLRVNWYDSGGRPGGNPDEQQEKIGMLPRVKLRLGRLSYGGEQKGVDLRIGLDLATHSRNRIVDIVYLLSGDDDLTEAVEEAQHLGAQVIVFAVPDKDGKPNGVSKHLWREADDVQLVDAALIDDTVFVRQAPTPPTPDTSAAEAAETGAAQGVPAPSTVAPKRATPVPAGPASLPSPANMPTKRIDRPAPTHLPFDLDKVDPALLVDADEEHAIGAVASAVARTWMRTASPSEREHLLHRKPSIPPELDRALLVDLSTRLGAYEISEPVRFRLRTRFWEAAETAAHE